MTLARAWLLVGGVALVLLASLIWASMQLVWHLAGHTSALPFDVPAAAATDAPKTPTDIGAIIALVPFGTAVSDLPKVRTAESTSKISVALRGVLLDADPQKSRAFVQTDGGIGVYRPGDPVQSAELVSIDTETITLRSGEDLIVVGFTGIENAAEGSTGQAAEPVAAPTNDPFSRLAAAIVPGHGSIDLRDGPPPETTDDYINLWRTQIVRDPQAAMDSVGVELVENGYRIKSDPDIGVTLAGLRPGDVITSLNGQSIGDLDKDRKLYDDVAAAGIARLEVVRDGQSMLLTFPLR